MLHWKTSKLKWSIARGIAIHFKNWTKSHWIQMFYFLFHFLCDISPLFAKSQQVYFVFKFKSVSIGLQNLVLSVILEPVNSQMNEMLTKWRKGFLKFKWVCLIWISQFFLFRGKWMYKDSVHWESVSYYTCLSTCCYWFNFCWRSETSDWSSHKVFINFLFLFFLSLSLCLSLSLSIF